MMTLDPSASGGGVAGGNGDMFGFPRGVGTADSRDDPRLNSTAFGIGRSTAGSNSGSFVAGAATRLKEAWSLLEASEAARRRLQEEGKRWADRASGLEESLATAEATAEEKGREARLLAASLQDARDGLATEEAARREAEGRAEALRYSNVYFFEGGVVSGEVDQQGPRN